MARERCAPAALRGRWRSAREYMYAMPAQKAATTAMALLAQAHENGLGIEEANAVATKLPWPVSAQPEEISSATEGSGQAPVSHRHGSFRFDRFGQS